MDNDNGLDFSNFSVINDTSNNSDVIKINEDSLINGEFFLLECTLE